MGIGGLDEVKSDLDYGNMDHPSERRAEGEENPYGAEPVAVAGEDLTIACWEGTRSHYCRSDLHDRMDLVDLGSIVARWKVKVTGNS